MMKIPERSFHCQSVFGDLVDKVSARVNIRPQAHVEVQKVAAISTHAHLPIRVKLKKHLQLLACHAKLSPNCELKISV